MIPTYFMVEWMQVHDERCLKDGHQLLCNPLYCVRKAQKLGAERLTELFSLE